jgi:hypothetical protein
MKEILRIHCDILKAVARPDMRLDHAPFSLSLISQDIPRLSIFEVDSSVGTKISLINANDRLFIVECEIGYLER